MRCYKRCNCRRNKPCCDLKDVEGCWDNCRCMDEILDNREAIEDIDDVVNNALGRVVRSENVIRENLQNTDRLITNFTEKHDSDVQQLTSTINTNDSTIRSALAQEVSRATAAEQGLSQEIDTKITNLVNSAPEALDTLGEIASRLADDSSVAAAIVNTIADETSARQAADTTLQNNITAEVNRATGVEATLLPKTDAADTYLTKADAATLYQPVGNYQPAGNYQQTGSYATTAQAIGGVSISGNTLTFTSVSGATIATITIPNYWTDNGTTLTANSGRSVTGAGFYDSTIN